MKRFAGVGRQCWLSQNWQTIPIVPTSSSSRILPGITTPIRTFASNSPNPHPDELVDEKSSTLSTKPSIKTKFSLFSREFNKYPDLMKKARKIKPALQPSFTFAPYVNESTLLQSFIKLGVDLTKWERERVPDEIMGLRFDRDVVPVLFHLHDLGVPDEDLGRLLSKNPYILINGLTDLKEKTDYFLRKKFTKDQLSRILIKCPQAFSRAVETIDGRLGFFQQKLDLTGDQIRLCISTRPELLKFKLDYFSKLHFHMVKVSGFSQSELREMFIVCPTIFLQKPETLEKRFQLLHNEMKIPHQTIARFPYLLNVPDYVTRRRHKFLKSLDRAVYDPLDPKYVSLTAFTNHDDRGFAETVVGVDFETYQNFLKTQ